MPATTLTGRYVYIDGDIYAIAAHIAGTRYSAHLDSTDLDGNPTEPDVKIDVTSYHGNPAYWPFNGRTLEGRLA